MSPCRLLRCGLALGSHYPDFAGDSLVWRKGVGGPGTRRGLPPLRHPDGVTDPRPSASRIRLMSDCVNPLSRLVMPSEFSRFVTCVFDRFSPRLLSRLCSPARLLMPVPPARPHSSCPSRPWLGTALIVT